MPKNPDCGLKLSEKARARLRQARKGPNKTVSFSEIKRKYFDKTIDYDVQNDVLYLGAQAGIEEEQVEIAPGISAELDASGKVIGVEVLNASRVFKGVARLLESKSLQTA